MWVYNFSGGTNILTESPLPTTLPQKRTDLPNACSSVLSCLLLFAASL